MATVTAAQREAFEKALDLDGFRRLAVMHLDQVKIMDSWARQSMSKIRHSSTIDGKDPLVAALNVLFLRNDYLDRNIIYVQSVPIRQGLTDFVQDPAEKQRMTHEGLVSYDFLTRADVQQYLEQQSSMAKSAKGVGELMQGAETFSRLAETLQLCPPEAGHRSEPWVHPRMLWANYPEGVKALTESGQKIVPVAGYSADQAGGYGWG